MKEEEAKGIKKEEPTTKKGRLLAGWTEYSMPNGRFYYYNANTRTTQWQKPADFLEAGSYQLQATSYKLQVTSCTLQAASCKLQATSYKLQAASYKLQATSYKLQGTSYKLQATSYKLQATSYKLQATSYKLQVDYSEFLSARATSNR